MGSVCTGPSEGEGQGRGRIEVEGYGRRTRKGQEVGVLTEWEVGEIGENYTTVPNVLQSKRD